ncbi:Chromosome transmission fidelity protein 18 [Coemansia sp. RSA 988]|nr:Chromosome transmission fidelity protein 18 [Coemansia sp. RSA 988]
MRQDSSSTAQGLFGSRLQSSLLSSMKQTHTDTSDEDKQKEDKNTLSLAAIALNRLGSTTEMQLPDSIDEDDFLGEQPSHGLTLLPTAEYSDDDVSDEDDGIFTSLNSMLRRNIDDEQEPYVAEIRADNDWRSGEENLETYSDGEKKTKQHNIGGMVNAEKPDIMMGGEWQLSRKEQEDSKKQGILSANILKINQLRKRAAENKNLKQSSLGMFSASERFDAYQKVLARQAKVNAEASSSKRHKSSHNGEQSADQRPAEAQQTAAMDMTGIPLHSLFKQTGRHLLPPETGEFLTARTTGGTMLYFGVRADTDLEKRESRVALCQQTERMDCMQANSAVAAIESDLDARAVEMEQDEIVAESGGDGKLWVDKYRARSYVDLLSDERTSRAVMQWLKEWDYCVFGRERGTAKAKGTTGQDRWRRPEQRVLLLAGPAGLGKTTLAHVAARQAGYEVVEINASDDRTASRVRERIAGVTQTRAVGKRPQLLILDEIDGAAAGQGDFVGALARAAAADGRRGAQLRPIICICNNAYAPVLRPLRQTALALHVGAPTAARVAQRLADVCTAEGVSADAWTLLELAQQNTGDVRASVNALQLATRGTRSLSAIGAAGAKDAQRSLRAAWNLIFLRATDDRAQAQLVVNAAQTSGDSERLMQGCFENYLRTGFRDLTHTRLARLCADWLVFHDQIDATTRRNPATVAALTNYQAYAILAVHRTCSTPFGLSRDAFEYPQADAALSQGRQAATVALQALVGGAKCVRTQAGLTVSLAAMELADYMTRILAPRLTTANRHLLKEPESTRLRRLVEIMSTWSVALVQNRDGDGRLAYCLDPPVDRLVAFRDRRLTNAPVPIRYSVRQLIFQELARVRAASTEEAEATAAGHSKQEYLRQLRAGPQPASARPAPAVTTDFFGRPRAAASSSDEANLPLQPSHTWFSFVEGFSNAVRKPTTMRELL